MLHKNDENRVNQVQMVSIDSLVPKNHLLRKIEETIDFSFIYGFLWKGLKEIKVKKNSNGYRI